MCKIKCCVNPTYVAWKVTVIGERSSGKTCLISKICYDSFDSNGCKNPFKTLIKKSLKLDNDGVSSKADIFFHEINELNKPEKSVMGSSAIIVTLDVTNSDAFRNTDLLLKYLKTFRKNKLQILVATKIDRKYEAKVWDEELTELSQKYGIAYIKTSSKTGEGIDELLREISSNLTRRITTNER